LVVTQARTCGAASGAAGRRSFGPDDYPSSEGFADRIDAGRLLWDEYKYRHDLIWKLVFQLTTAVILINTAPYLEADGLDTPCWPSR
jgi:hypothetical protein